MKLLTSSNIILDNNIIAIYTNVEKFLTKIENYSCDPIYLLNIDERDIVKIQSCLFLDDSLNKKEKFVGLFYSLDPDISDINIWWTTLSKGKNYNRFLQAINDDEMFIWLESEDDTFTNDLNLTKLKLGLEHTETENDIEEIEDEYDNDNEELESELLDAYLENWDNDNE